MKKKSIYFKWGLTAFLVVLFSSIAAYIIFHLSIFSGNISKFFNILTPITEGIIFAYLMTPFLNMVERKLVIPIFKKLKKENKVKTIRAISTIITIAFFLFIIIGFFAIVIPQIAKSIGQIIEQFPTYLESLEVWLTKMLQDYPDLNSQLDTFFDESSTMATEFIETKIVPQLNDILMTVSKSVISIIKQFFNIIVGIIISVYLLSSKEQMSAQAKKIAYSLFSVESANRYISNMRFASKTFSGFFIGKIVDSAIIGVLCYICTIFIGTPFNLLISVIIGVTNIIPFFGPFIGAIPSLILIVLVDPWQALYFLVFILILQQVDGNIIGPKILGSSTGLSSFWVIFAITLFGGIWGVGGMILGVPIFAVIFSFIKSSVENRLVLKELPSETPKYLKLLYIDVDSLEMVRYSTKEKSAFENITKIIVRSQNRVKKHEEDKEISDKLNKKESKDPRDNY